ncbi:MAG: HPr family phosphocarrier protein [Lachnospiraceae bacterium]|nr:HPr family phosphocarrier protein [Lachnospiraceae bacterium]
MTTRKMEIQLPTGLEARPLAMLVQVASQFESKIYVESEDKKINAKSIMGMMGLGLATGEEIQIMADGADEETALDSIEKYLSNK